MGVGARGRTGLRAHLTHPRYNAPRRAAASSAQRRRVCHGGLVLCVARRRSARRRGALIGRARACSRGRPPPLHVRPLLPSALPSKRRERAATQSAHRAQNGQLGGGARWCGGCSAGQKKARARAWLGGTGGGRATALRVPEKVAVALARGRRPSRRGERRRRAVPRLGAAPQAALEGGAPTPPCASSRGAAVGAGLGCAPAGCARQGE